MRLSASMGVSPTRSVTPRQIARAGGETLTQTRVSGPRSAEQPQLGRARQPLDARLLAQRLRARCHRLRPRELDRQPRARVAARLALVVARQARVEVRRPAAVQAAVAAAQQI